MINRAISTEFNDPQSAKQRKMKELQSSSESESEEVELE
jgi:hypothetical protein